MSIWLDLIIKASDGSDLPLVDNGDGTYELHLPAGTGGGITAIVEDLTPQLGGELETLDNAIAITDGGSTVWGRIKRSAEYGLAIVPENLGSAFPGFTAFSRASGSTGGGVVVLNGAGAVAAACTESDTLVSFGAAVDGVELKVSSRGVISLKPDETSLDPAKKRVEVLGDLDVSTLAGTGTRNIGADATGRLVDNQAALDAKGQVNSVVGGTDIDIDATDPKNPIANYTGSGGGSTLTQTPIAPTTGTTVMEWGKWYLVDPTGITTGGATLRLPAPAADGWLRISMLADAPTSWGDELILLGADGTTEITRLMLGDESMEFGSDGTNNIIVGDARIPLSLSVNTTSSGTIQLLDNVWTKLTNVVFSTILNNTGAMFNAATGEVNTRREGRFSFTGNIQSAAPVTTPTNFRFEFTNGVAPKIRTSTTTFAIGDTPFSNGAIMVYFDPNADTNLYVNARQAGNGADTVTVGGAAATAISLIEAL